MPAAHAKHIGAAGDIPLEEAEFTYFRALLAELTGISVSEKKADLVASRLRSHVLKRGLTSYGAYRKILEASAPEGDDLQMFINLLTTNKTDFFREIQHFTYLEDRVIPTFARAPGKRLSVWCAACATGEEPYSLALVLKSHLAPISRFTILATDIDTKVLALAVNGVYPLGCIGKIPEAYREHNLTSGEGTAVGWFKIADSLHSTVTFRQHNLTDDSVPSTDGFDIIFCRNVLIYFSAQTIARVAAKLHRLLKPGGLLFIGHTESLTGSKHLFRSIKPSIFQKL